MPKPYWLDLFLLFFQFAKLRWQVDQIAIRPRLALDDVAAAEAPRLNMASGKVGVADAPDTTFRVLQHHDAVDAADIVSECVKIPVGARLHETLPQPTVLAETA